MDSRLRLFRVAFSAVMLADVAHLYVHRGLFPAPHLGYALPSWLAVLAALLVGWHTRIAAVLNYLFAVTLLGFDPPYSQAAADSIAISLSLLAMLLPLDGTAPSKLARVALPAFLALVYFDSGLRKLQSHLWRAGLGIVAPAGLPSLAWTDTSWMEWMPPGMLRLMGWGVIVFELGFPLLMLSRAGRILALVAGVSMHVGIAWIYPIPAFSGLMIAAYAGLLPDAFLARPARPGAAAPSRRGDAGLVAFLAMTLLLWASVPLRASSRFAGLGRAISTWSFRVAGVAPHAVFSDALFHRYTYQLRLVPAAGPTVPYSRGSLLGWDCRDRLWEDWWKRAQAPRSPMCVAEARLVAWGARRGPCAIEARPQDVELCEARPGLFSVNDVAPWRRVGRIECGRAAWDEPPRDGEDLGDYLNRILGCR